MLYNLELTSDFVEIIENSKGSNITSTHFSLYPNPGSDQLFINIADADHFIVTIKDILGRGFGEFYGNDSSIEINTRDIPNGTYVITVKNEEFLEPRVWIKK